MKNLSLFLVLLFLFIVPASAQRSLTAMDKKYIKTQTFDYIKVFVHTVNDLGSTNNLPEKTKEIMIKFALSYFKKDATVQTMNLGKDKNTYTIKEYLRHVADYPNRFSFVLTKINVVSFNFNDLVPKIDANGDTTAYTCSYSYVQEFDAKKGLIANREKFNSADPHSYDISTETTKKGTVIIEKEYSPTVGDRWVILLGDITAGNIENLQDK